jgi:lipoyl(octanoyl) transferase 2
MSQSGNLVHRLGHLRLPRLTPYLHAAQIQEAIQRNHFFSKDLQRKAASAGDQPTITAPPDPVVLTAEFQPVYTFGRRQLKSVNEAQRHFLQDSGKAAVVEAQRGGQVTYHGPGQLVAYPIIDLRRHRITPRDYVHLLEDTVMAVCARFAVSNVETTTDPGVWIKGGQRKICAVGVQISRGITAHGIGLNVTDREHYLSWGFGRIVACGLEGKQVTWLSREQCGPADRDIIDVDSVAAEFVKAFAARLGNVDEIYQASNPETKVGSDGDRTV